MGIGRGWAGLAILMIAAATPSFAASETKTGEKLFQTTCAMCHSPEPGTTRLGPSLAGVVGRKAGTLEGYNFSPALQKSGIVWTAEALNTWISGPAKDVPGAHMYFQGVSDPAQRKAIIAYLKSISTGHK